MLAQYALIGDAVGENVVTDLLGSRPPLLGALRVAANLGEAGGAVEGDPAHELRSTVQTSVDQSEVNAAKA